MVLLKRGYRKLRREAFDLLYMLGLESWILSSREGAAILCYHGVDSSGDKSLNMRHISKQSLECHFKLFRKYFNVISVEEYFEGKFVKGRCNIALTFDDGYRNNFKYLIPLVEAYALPASIYVTGMNQTAYDYLWSDFLDIVSRFSRKDLLELGGMCFSRVEGAYVADDGRNLKTVIREDGGWSLKEELYSLFPDFKELAARNVLGDYWELMSDDQIVSADRSPFITIGSHGYYHNNLGNITLEEAMTDLRMSKDYLEGLLQREVDQLAYPDGSYTRKLLDTAFGMGFTRQLAVGYQWQGDDIDPRILDRHGMYPVYSELNQVYDVLENLR